MKPLILNICLLCIAAQFVTAELSVRTRFSQPRVALGNPVQYIVEITAIDAASQPNIPPITSLPIQSPPGLRLRNGRNSSNSQTRIVNGQTEYRITQSATIDAIPSAIGSYSIPAFQIEVNGETLEAPAATLQVVEKAADAAPTLDELTFLEVEAPQSLYIGQSSKIRLNLYVADRMRLSGVGNFESTADGFSMIQDPNKYSERRLLRNGRDYRVLTWEIEATALTAGRQALNFQIDVSARMPGKAKSGNQSPFGRSLFDDFFEPTQRYPIDKEHTIHVLPLPEENKPPSFDGAVGRFSMEVFTDLQETTVGEPIMYSIRLTGEGNFDRIQGLVLSESPDWKPYSPQAVMEDSGAVESTTTKRFDYVMTPLRAGQIKTPAIQFAYFDPQTAAYVTLQAPPIPIAVQAAKSTFTPPSSAAPTPKSQEESEQPLSRSLTREEALMTLDYQPREKTLPDTIHPFQSNSFRMTQGFLFLLLVATALYLRRRTRLLEDPHFLLSRKVRKAAKQAHKEAIAATTASEFYIAALSAVRHTATARTGRDQSNATMKELRALIPNPEKNSRALDALQKLCLQADALHFSGKEPSTDPKTLQPLLNQLLEVL